MEDPRLGKTSASKFHVTANCPGQQRFIQTLPPEAMEVDPSDREYAEGGTAIHLALQNGDTSNLDPEQIETYNDALKYLDQMVQTWRTENNLGGDFVELEREQRLWIHNSTMQPIASAQLDRQYRCGRHMLVVDFKTLYCKTLSPAESNWQGRVQAVAAWREYEGVDQVRFGLCKPKIRRSPSDTVDYLLDDLQYAERDIHFRIWKAEQPDAERTPGTWCNFCPGKGYCKESAAYSMLPSVYAGTSLPSKAKERDAALASMVEQLSLEDCKLLWSRTLIISKVLDAAKARLKRQDAETLSSMGLTSSPGRISREITDTKAVFDLLKAQFNCSDEDLWKILKFSIGAIVGLLQEKHEFTSKHATEWVRANFEKWIEKKEAEASLELK